MVFIEYLTGNANSKPASLLYRSNFEKFNDVFSLLTKFGIYNVWDSTCKLLSERGLGKTLGYIVLSFYLNTFVVVSYWKFCIYWVVGVNTKLTLCPPVILLIFYLQN